MLHSFAMIHVKV